MPQTALIWLKRDLRLDDHAPLAAAAAFDAAAAVYVIEPAWLASAECDSQHVAFALEGLAELRRTLAARGLALLVRNPDRLVTREAILTEVWGPHHTSDSGYLRLYLAQLRKKLEPEPSRPRFLITEAGMGYRFVPGGQQE